MTMVNCPTSIQFISIHMTLTVIMSIPHSTEEIGKVQFVFPRESTRPVNWWDPRQEKSQKLRLKQEKGIHYQKRSFEIKSWNPAKNPN